MYKISIPFDESTKCYFNGEPLPSKEEINVDANLGNQIYCNYVDGTTYRGLAMENEPNAVVNNLDEWYQDHGEKYHDDTTIVLVPVFGKGDYMNIILLRYNGTTYTVPINKKEPQPVRNYVNQVFPPDKWYTEDIVLVNNEKNEQYKMDQMIEKGGVYDVTEIDPYVTFKVDGDILQFADSPKKTSIKYKIREFGEPPKLKVRDHYKFTGWSSSGGKLDEIQTSLFPIEFTGSAILMRWIVKFKDCGDTVTKTVNDGEYVVNPPSCSKVGHTFNGWKESFTTCKSSNISIWLIVILFIISAIVLFMPSKSSYIRNITRGIQSKTSY